MQQSIEDLTPVSIEPTKYVELPPAAPEKTDADHDDGGFRLTVVEKADGESREIRALLDSSTRPGVSGELLDPPYDPEKMLTLFEASSGIRPNVDVIATNVDAFGHHFEPVVDLDGVDAFERVKGAMYLERLLAAEEQSPLGRGNGARPDISSEVDQIDSVQEPTDEEVKARLKALRILSRIELSRAKAFFAYANPDGSFVSLRMQRRLEVETVGNAYWEVLRDKIGRVARLVYTPAVSMRITACDAKSTEIVERVRTSDFMWKDVTQRRHFRRFAQVNTTTLVGQGAAEDVTTWFKEFGDPRLVSKATGKYYNSLPEMLQNEPEAIPATEIIHFKIFSPSSAYGVPRWVGNLPGVLGSRELDEVNEAYFDNKAVPPLLLLVSGGRLATSTVARFQDFFRTEVKGRKNFHKIAILEAEPAPSTAGPSAPNVVPKIALERLRDAQQDDGLFQNYDDRNLKKLAASFRIPESLRGAATAGPAMYAALRQTETQVFKPERNEFDEFMNRQLLPAIGIRFWTFKSNAPEVFDPETLGKVIAELTKEGVLTPGEGRSLAGTVFNRELATINEEWTRRPLAITLATMRAVSGPAEAARVTEGAPVAAPGEVLQDLAAPLEDGPSAPVPRPKRVPARPIEIGGDEPEPVD